jgi:hypothetical protein
MVMNKRFARLALLAGVTATAAAVAPAHAVAAPAPATASVTATATADSAVGGPITRSEVLTRARAWVGNTAITYSQTGYYPDPQGRQYRRDCSGFASMALHAGQSYDTQTFVSSGAVTRLGSGAQLQPGDLVGLLGPGTGGDNGHVMVFVRWNDTVHHSFTVYEQNGADNANYPHQSTYTWPMSDWRGTYAPYRYTHIVDDPAAVPQSHVRAGDVDGDGRADLVAIQRDGKLNVYLGQGGTGTNTWGPSTYAGYGWNFRDVEVADVDGDHKADLIAIDDDGKMYVYPNQGGSGTSTWGPSAYAGYGWNFAHVLAGDVDGDGRADLVAIDDDGKMYVYPNKGGTGTSTWGPSTYAGYGWNAYSKVLLGDANGDGRADLTAVDGDAKLHVYLNKGGTGTDTWGANTYAGYGWTFPGLTIGDVNGDGRADLTAIDTDGNLSVYPAAGGTGTGAWGQSYYAGNGWNAYTF